MLGRSEDGKSAVIAYFIMGRSANSRNRVFTAKDGGIITEAADPSKLEDPSLIIYAPVRVLGKTTIVTNGDQTDTIYDHLAAGKGFAKALRTRTFEPDSPNFTPRISGIVKVKDGAMKYKLSILKSDGGNADSVERFFFEYDQPVAGEGRFIHTYRCDGAPSPASRATGARAPDGRYRHVYKNGLEQPERGQQGFAVCAVYRPCHGQNAGPHREQIRKSVTRRPVCGRAAGDIEWGFLRI